MERIQRFGGHLSGMVIPNIGAFIAWGLITALVIPTGWLAVLGFGGGSEGEIWQSLEASISTPIIRFLLPTLVAYTGGKVVHGHRGGVLAAIAVFGVIGGAQIDLDLRAEAGGFSAQPPQFLGAMVIGPLSGWIMKKIDGFLEARTPLGFEMLFNNFSLGFTGLGLVFVGYSVVGPVFLWLSNGFASVVGSIQDAGFLPLADIPIEVGKVLFLNNGINHGVLVPLGTQEAATDQGRSILFLLESNPGPGLGLLCAYWFVGKGPAKLAAPGAILVHFFGGIHEVYFPYVLMNPVTILAVWAGGISANLMFVATDAGLVGPPSPGSIFAYLINLPPGAAGASFGVIAGVAVAAVVSFATGSMLLRIFPVKEPVNTELDVTMSASIADDPGQKSPGTRA